MRHSKRMAFEVYGIDVRPEAVAGMERNTLYLDSEARDLKGIDDQP